jgi:hypothetical protein
MARRDCLLACLLGVQSVSSRLRRVCIPASYITLREDRGAPLDRLHRRAAAWTRDDAWHVGRGTCPTTKHRNAVPERNDADGVLVQPSLFDIGAVCTRACSTLATARGGAREPEGVDGFHLCAVCSGALLRRQPMASRQHSPSSQSHHQPD